MKTVTINRDKWLRGVRPHDKSGGIAINYMWDKRYNGGCCLGHVAKQISRKTEAELDRKCQPESVYQKASFLTNYVHDDWDDSFSVIDNDFAEQAMEINDDFGLTEEEREEQLIHLFKENNIVLKFV